MCDFRGQLAFAGQRDRVQFDIQVGLENRRALLEQIFSFCLIAVEGEVQAGIHLLRRFLHVLGRDHAAIIFSENDVNRSAQLGEEENGIDADA